MNTSQQPQELWSSENKVFDPWGLFVRALLILVTCALLAPRPVQSGVPSCSSNSSGVCVQLSATPGLVLPGGWVNYTATAINNGPNSYDFTLAMHVPDHMTAVAGTYGNYTCSGQLPSGDCPAGAWLSRSLGHIGYGTTVSDVFAFRLDSGVNAPANGTVIPAWATATAINNASASATANVRVQNTTPVAPRLINLSTRGWVGLGENVMIGGFVIGGTTPHKVLIRAIGPSMSAAGVIGTAVSRTKCNTG